MHSFPRPVALLAIAAALVPLAGCGALGGRNNNRIDQRYVARDVNTLYNAAYDRLQRRNYAQAAALFDEVERQHPYSVWARRAQLMSAFSYYAAGDHTKSIESARRFLSIHPGNRDAPYALYLIALNYYEQISDVTRDQAITRQALDALGEVVRRYPGTSYADDSRLKIDLVNDHLAGKEMEIGRFYQRRNQWLASVIRFRTVIDQYQTTSHTPEALMRLTESYLALGIPDQAQRSAAVLGANYPESRWYQRAYQLMQRNDRRGQAAATPPAPPTPVPAPAEPAQPTPAPAETPAD
ncbi:outer membrane protein assembly factor BamD [Sphingosinicella sp. LHD-64]|uniref:outer membrane protein assembly factor BamD n=1 Tax=Sphingosinicella sp. LHD-64 TaxID=3072139 RepID=UPI00280DF925|nr:outer membrane protein assembly factor BamD [Sphingosinicella sp. LHD-64]MDQ8755962.1 outer membrane protein assembly factor BamD [Sphingosinicella sp. LHD-64]